MLPVDYCHTLKQVLYKLFFVRYEIKQRKATQLYENEGHHIVAATPPGVAGWPILLKWVQRLWDKICYKWCVTTPAVCEHDYPTQFHLLGLALILQSDSYLHVRAAGNNFRLCACKSFFCLPFLPTLSCSQQRVSKALSQNIETQPDCNGAPTQSLSNRRLVVTLMTDYPKIRLSPITDILIC